MSMNNFISVMWVVVIVVGLSAFADFLYSTLSHVGSQMFEVGDCIAFTSDIEDLDSLERWESKEIKVKKVLEKGVNSYRAKYINPLSEHTLDYGVAHLYSKVNCETGEVL